MGFWMVSTVKTCITCNKELSIDSFYKSGRIIMSYCKECQKEYRKSRYNKLTKERESLTGLQYRQNNTEKQRLAVRVAKRRLKALTLGLVHEDWTEQQLIDTYGTVCYLCNKKIDFDAPKCGEGSDYSSWPDHVIPTSRGGENTIKNVRPCHKTCNISKKNKTYEEYMLTVNSQDIVTQSL